MMQMQIPSVTPTTLRKITITVNAFLLPRNVHMCHCNEINCDKAFDAYRNSVEFGEKHSCDLDQPIYCNLI